MNKITKFIFSFYNISITGYFFFRFRRREVRGPMPCSSCSRASAGGRAAPTRSFDHPPLRGEKTRQGWIAFMKASRISGYLGPALSVKSPLMITTLSFLTAERPFTALH